MVHDIGRNAQQPVPNRWSLRVERREVFQRAQEDFTNQILGHLNVSRPAQNVRRDRRVMRAINIGELRFAATRIAPHIIECRWGFQVREILPGSLMARSYIRSDCGEVPENAISLRVLPRPPV